jgi:hypothetical protein
MMEVMCDENSGPLLSMMDTETMTTISVYAIADSVEFTNGEIEEAFEAAYGRALKPGEQMEFKKFVCKCDPARWPIEGESNAVLTDAMLEDVLKKLPKADSDRTMKNMLRRTDKRWNSERGRE